MVMDVNLKHVKRFNSLYTSFFTMHKTLMGSAMVIRHINKTDSIHCVFRDRLDNLFPHLLPLYIVPLKV